MWHGNFRLVDKEYDIPGYRGPSLKAEADFGVHLNDELLNDTLVKIMTIEKESDWIGFR